MQREKGQPTIISHGTGASLGVGMQANPQFKAENVGKWSCLWTDVNLDPLEPRVEAETTTADPLRQAKGRATAHALISTILPQNKRGEKMFCFYFLHNY